MEIWKNIPGFEGHYKVSNLGKIKSCKRTIKTNRGQRSYSDKLIKACVNNRGYVYVALRKEGKSITFPVHQLVAISFLNHKLCGHKLVVNHINFDKTNNSVSNLEVITQRENCSHRQSKTSSKYVGVSWNKKLKKWTARISIGKKYKHLGVFINEKDANIAYQNKLKEISQ